MTSNGSSRLKSATDELVRTASDRAIGAVSKRVSGATDRLEGLASGTPAKAAVGALKSTTQGGSSTTGALKGTLSSVKDKVTDKLPGGSSKSGDNGGKATDSTNIIEQIDVGVPLRVAYNQWTEFGGFPSFMKKVENVETEEDNKLEFKAQIFWSHRSWEATILEQVPDERIVWRSKGEKGHVDGAVTFHELGPNLTRILVVLEYYPQGFMEKTGNIWRAQGRRARAELKHFRRHVMTRTILDPEEVEGWRGTIHDGEVVESHEDAMEREAQESDQQSEQQSGHSDPSARPDQSQPADESDQGADGSDGQGEQTDQGDQGDQADQADTEQSGSDQSDSGAGEEESEEESEDESPEEAEDFADDADEGSQEEDGDVDDGEEFDEGEESQSDDTFDDEDEEPQATSDVTEGDEEFADDDSESEDDSEDLDEDDEGEDEASGSDTEEETDDGDDSEQDLAPDEDVADDEEDEPTSQSGNRRRAS